MNRPKVSRPNWSLSGRTISKRFGYHRQHGRWGTQYVDVAIEFRPSRATKILEPSFTLVLNPNPLPDWDSGMLDASIAYEDQAIEPSPPMLVYIDSSTDGRLAVLSYSAEDAAVLIDELCRGKDIRFTIQDGDDILLMLPIPNDDDAFRLIRRASLS